MTRERIIIVRDWAQYRGGLSAYRDYTTPTAPVTAWFEAVEAPSKQAVWFEHSAHLAPWEEPGKFLVSLLAHLQR